jgi:hypothetical protein
MYGVRRKETAIDQKRPTALARVFRAILSPIFSSPTASGVLAVDIQISQLKLALHPGGAGAGHLP